jgi:hypothetical protein
MAKSRELLSQNLDAERVDDCGVFGEYTIALRLAIRPFT